VGFLFDDNLTELRSDKSIRTELKRIEKKRKIVLDPFQPTPYSSAPLTQQGRQTKCGEVSEWLKEHAWKVCIRQRIGGSNPPLTAIISKKSLNFSSDFFLPVAQ
jgi:hypothetical protein